MALAQPPSSPADAFAHAGSDASFFYAHDLEHRFTYLSPAVLDVLGYTPDELVGTPYDDLMATPQSARDADSATTQTLAGARTHSFRALVRHRSGRELLLEFSEAPITWPGGQVVGIRGVARDVTERDCTVERFEHVSAVLESISDCLFSLDRSWRFSFVNARAESFFGLPRADLLRRSLWQLHPLLGEGPLRQRMEQALTEQTTVAFEAEWAPAPGTWLEFRVHPSPDGVTVVVQDVTGRRAAEAALRRSEEYHRALIENGADLISVVGADGAHSYLSPSFTRLLGYTRDELDRMDPMELLHPDDREPARIWIAELTGSAHMTAGMEIRVRHRDGAWHTLQATATNLLEHPAVRGIVINAHDTTARLLLADQLRQAQKMEAIGRLAGGVAHDFNNLLTTIRGHADFVAEGLAPADPLRDDTEQIIRAADSAAGLTRQLLLFSRKRIAQSQVIVVRDVVRSMEQLLRRVIGEDVRLATTVDGDAGHVDIDAGHVEQILMNLVLNARDAMPHGGSITISAARVALTHPVTTVHDRIEPGMYSRISVADSGAGIDRDVLPLILEPFFTTKEPGKGTGLGLATVYGIVKQNGGGIRVTSSPGAGTTFDIYLPCIDAAPTRAAGPTAAVAPGGSESVLVVEDDPAVRTLIRRSLQRRGYSVMEAASGAGALKLAGENLVDMVLTDVVMPGMTGRELAELLHLRRPDLPILFMSGYTEDEVLRRGVREAEVHFLEKPFTPAMLAAAVRAVLDATAPAPRADS